jgi:hypothetical protein
MNEHDMNILWPYIPGSAPRGRATARMTGGQSRDRVQALIRQRMPNRSNLAPLCGSQVVRPPLQLGVPGSITLGRSREFGPYSWHYLRIKVQVLGGVALPASGSAVSGQRTQDSVSAEISHAISERLSVAAGLELDDDARTELGQAVMDDDASRFGRVLAKHLGITAALNLDPFTITVGMQYDEHLCFWNAQVSYQPTLGRLEDVGVSQDIQFSGQVVISFGATEAMYLKIAERIGGRAVRSAVQRWVSRQLSRPVMSQLTARLAGVLEAAGIVAVTVAVSAIVTIEVLELLDQAQRRGRRWGALNDYALGYLRRGFSEELGFPRYPPQVGHAAHGWNDAQRALQRSRDQVRSALIRNFANGLNLTDDRNLPTMANRFWEFLDAHQEDVARYIRRRDSQRIAG